MLESDNQSVNQKKEARFVPPPNAVPVDETPVSALDAESATVEDVAAVPVADPKETKGSDVPMDVAKTDADLDAETPPTEQPKPVAAPAETDSDSAPWYAKPYCSGGHHRPEDRKPEKKQRRKDKEEAPFREDLDFDHEQRRRARSFEKRGERRERPERRERRERFFDEDDRFPTDEGDTRHGHVMTAEERAQRSWLDKDGDGDRPERSRRRDDGGDRGRPRFGGGRSPRRFDDDRPPRRFRDRDEGAFGGERRERDSFRKPRRFDDDRPHFGGGKPRRFDDDRPRFGGGKPRRFDDDGPRFGGGRQRRFDDDRPPRRFSDRDEGGFGGDREDRDSFRRPRRPGGDGPRFGGSGGFRSKIRKSRDGEFRKRGGFNSHRRNNRPKK